MRFNLAPTPKLGDKREVSRFVFFKKIDKEIRVFEFATWVEEYKESYCYDDYGDPLLL